MEQREGEIRLLDASPGCSVLSIASPRRDRPPMQMLVEAMAACRSKFPTRFVTDLEVVRLGGVPNMLCVQWRDVARPPFTCQVLDSVRQKYRQEYVEVLAADAVRFTEQYPNDFPVTALISKREAVLVIVKRKNICYVGMLSDFLPLLRPESAAEIFKRFEEFQHSSETGYGFVRLPDNFDISSS